MTGSMCLQDIMGPLSIATQTPKVLHLHVYSISILCTEQADSQLMCLCEQLLLAIDSRYVRETDNLSGIFVPISVLLPHLDGTLRSN